MAVVVVLILMGLGTEGCSVVFDTCGVQGMENDLGRYLLLLLLTTSTVDTWGSAYCASLCLAFRRFPHGENE